MSTGIQWTDETWNPTTGCDRVSPGCANCYALTRAERNQAIGRAAFARRGEPVDPTAPYMRDGDPRTSGPGFGLMLHESRLDQPLRWKRPRRIFVNSMSDLFHPEVPDAFLDRTFAVMALADRHVFQVLTKRPERMRAYLTELVATARPLALPKSAGSVTPFRIEYPLPNVWVGTSVENARWRTRIDELRETPAAIRFLSCEPLLGPLVPRYRRWTYDDRGNHWPTGGAGNLWHDFPHEPGQRPEDCEQLDLSGIDWVIVGGESGQGARPLDERWVRDIVASSRAQGAAPFVKQLGDAWSREHLGHPGHAGEPDEWPEDLRVRESPAWG